MATEAWLNGPVEGVDPYLMPVAHALLQCREDVAAAAASLDGEQLWARPAGAASIGFHIRHIAGSVDRLLTYARGEALSQDQLDAAAREAPAGPEQDPGALVASVAAAVEAALAQLRRTSREALLQPREVGRKRLPSTTLGLLFHAAEHAQRHTGQLVTTAKIVRAGVR